MFSTSSSRFKEKFERFPVEARQSIEQTVNKNLEPFRKALGEQNQQLKEEILNLKDQLVHANEDRLRNIEALGDLHGKIRQQKMLEEVKRKELELVMFDKRNRHFGGSKQRTEIPDVPPKKFEFPKMPRNYETRIRQKVADKVLLDAPVLYSKSNFVQVPRAAAALNDNFDDTRAAGVVFDRNRQQFSEFYSPEKLAIPLSERFPRLEDDHLNKQNLVLPRFDSDKMDDDRNLIDIYNNNEDRLQALEIGRRTQTRVKKEQLDYDRVDKIIDSLDALKDRYFDDRYAHEGELERQDHPSGKDPNQYACILTQS